MNFKFKNIAVAAVTVAAATTLSGCAAAKQKEAVVEDETEIVLPTPEEPTPPEEIVVPAEKPEIKSAAYLSVTADGVNLRTGAGTANSSAGTAERDTLYPLCGENNGWYKTSYKNKTVYISKKYCVITHLPESGNERVEAVIAEGYKFLGTPYVYGAVRLHDGKGNMLKGFKNTAFDCSSLMQYMFYKGAGELLDVNTRTQVFQGKTVSKADLRRGDLMFFTNSSRKDKTGVERIGHVAMYLGGNYILHTASDYAKIESISAARWNYYIQSQRII